MVAMDGKTVRGVWEDVEQLRTLAVFSREGALALDQMKIESRPTRKSPGAALMWVKRVSSRFEGLSVLTGDALYAHPDLAKAILSEGKDCAQKNRPELHQDVELLFAEPTEADMELASKGHGRLENREV